MPIADVVKSHGFLIEIDGLDQLEIQTLTEPTVELTVAEHGAGGGLSIKTASRITTGDMTWEKVIPARSVANRWAWIEINRVINMETGLLGSPLTYKRNIVIRELNGDGTYANSYMAEGAFVRHIEKSQGDRVSDDNAMQTIIWSVDKYYQINT